MATFHSLNPPMGSHQNRNAPDIFTVDLELSLPQDHFLPAEDIQAEVWTNIIQRHNPDGPQVWSAIPMKLSNVMPSTSIAVFSAKIQPTGRGEFGLTARWKSHRSLTEWQWAPKEKVTDGVVGREDEQASKDVSVSVRVPRNMSSSPWTIGPQSVMVFTHDGPRANGMGVGGPGLYLGNHAAATRARISGYESVLSLVGDLLDFDQNIPECDRDVNKQVWLEQSQQQQNRFPSLSRKSSVASHRNSLLSDFTGRDREMNGGGLNGLSRRSSVADFMLYNDPGCDGALDTKDLLAAVVNDPVDPPRLSRKTSVTDKMVQAPASLTKKLSRSSLSAQSFTSMDEPGQQKNTAASTAAPNSCASTNGNTSLKANSIHEPNTEEATAAAPLQARNSSFSAATASEAAFALPPTVPLFNTTAKASNNKGSESQTTGGGGKKKKKADSKAAPAEGAETAAAKEQTQKQQQSEGIEATTVSSLDIAAAAAAAAASEAKPTSGSSTTITGVKKGNETTSASTSTTATDDAQSITKVVSSLYRQSQQALSSLSHLANNSTSTTSLTGLAAPPSKSLLSGMAVPSSSSLNPAAVSTASMNSTDVNSHRKPQTAPKYQQQQSQEPQRQILPKQPFRHKVISVAPGAHNVISDAVLKEAVEFLRTEISLGKKVLVHCRDGNGRGGSVVIAYVASQLEKSATRRGGRNRVDAHQHGAQKEMGGYYDEALKEVWTWKCDVYPHKGLRESVARIQW
ncbi:hypothetical protein BGZ98_008634 [Dissophora globulifera]|nr:hypothetical protein BGZ98_008634 [Dissophora globulifera]